ncbi:MAG: alpha/beta hydrolase [Anaerolineae bacterium]
MRPNAITQTWVRGLLLLLFVITAAGCQQVLQPAPARAPSTVQLTPCQLASSDASVHLAARCGKMTVYENRAAQSGRQIDLNLAVIPAISRNPAPDALFLIAGGPGDSATRSFVVLFSAFRQENEKRDIVLVDQRGAGDSHRLDCPAESDSEDAAAVRAWAADCVKRLDADLRFYTTMDAIGDLDQVRAALGYPQVNLYGVSYGTRVVQAYMARYPDRVRTATLDGVVSPDRPIGLTVSTDAQRALDLIFARCAADPACHDAFPDPAGDLAALLARVDQAPATVTVDDPVTGKPTPVTLTRSKLASTIQLYSYAPETAALIPLLLRAARASNDFTRFASQWLYLSSQLGDISTPMHDSVLCAEDVPYYGEISAATVDAEKRGYLGPSFTELAQLCQAWLVTPVPAEFKRSVTSTVPTLLLSGEADPITPPANAEQVAAHLSSSLQLVAPGEGHSIIIRGCVYKLVARFIEQGTVQGLATDCVQEIKPMPFFLSFTGTAP